MGLLSVDFGGSVVSISDPRKSWPEKIQKLDMNIHDLVGLTPVAFLIFTNTLC